MPGNTFGALFKVTTWGESHGPAIGAVIDGCPPGLDLEPSDIQEELDRRRPGKGGIAETTRQEPDRVQILSGVFEGKTTGTPISLIIWNKDPRPGAYDHLKDVYRPGHGDITYEGKYGLRDHRGGGRSSGRETAARVAAGAVAKKLLARHGIEVIAYTIALGGVVARDRDIEYARNNPFFCPDENAARAMEERVKAIRRAGDSMGGIVEILCRGVPCGLGDPVFDKLDAVLAQALMSIGAVKGVEIGSGFRAPELLGSENNDPITPHGFESNNAGGILAGISNGADIVVRAAIKPIPSIAMEQKTITRSSEPTTIIIGGRHDVAAIPRIVPVCAAMVRLTLADQLLRQTAIRGKWRPGP